MTGRLLLVLTLFLFVTCGRSGPPRATPVSGLAAPSPRVAETVDPLELFQPHEYLSSDGQRLPYRLFVPSDYDSARRYPLVVFLHGASASGTDNHRQLTGSGYWGTALWLSEKIQQTHSSLVLAPQANPPRGSAWVQQWKQQETERDEREPLELVIELIDDLQEKFAIDPARLYITGLSMGGFGAWSAITRYPNKFAAAVPVCGGGDPSAVEANQTAVWAFHGAKDRLVPPERSREMVEAFREAGAAVTYTEYSNLAHNSWERAYQEPELVHWLFSQRRQ